eukprot:10359648-Lingulodinium_polyedra.AAC.1
MRNVAQCCGQTDVSRLQRFARRTFARSMRGPISVHARSARFASRCNDGTPIRPCRCAAFAKRRAVM